MGVSQAIAEAISRRGREAEKNTLMEIRVGFAKDTLIPKMMRWATETKDKISPLIGSIHKALSFDLVNMCGDEFSNEVNLGGITVYPQPQVSVSVFGSYEPICSTIRYIVILDPVIETGNDVWSLVSEQYKTPIPEMLYAGESLKSRRPNFAGREMNIVSSVVEWPRISGQGYIKYLEDMWDYTADLLFILAGPIKKEK
jgi:hypothetical protein